MKRIISRLAFAGLLVGAIFFSVSAPRGGGVSLIQKAHATENTYQAYLAECDDGFLITVCGAGGPGCTPHGDCD
jgi:hypothetical protein